jgi:hypothetical protein
VFDAVGGIKQRGESLLRLSCLPGRHKLSCGLLDLTASLTYEDFQEDQTFRDAKPTASFNFDACLQRGEDYQRDH